jgi:membrane protease YdiL (CAAX protease family)
MLLNQELKKENYEICIYEYFTVDYRPLSLGERYLRHAGMKKALWLAFIYAMIQFACAVGLPNQLALAMLLSILLMTAYLGTFGFLSGDSRMYSPVSAPFLCWSLLFGVSTILLVDGLLWLLPPLPNWLDDSFNILQTGWLGILCLTLLAPILEELLFRGAIIRLLLPHYKPWIAILISGLIFGVIHANPAQTVPAILIGCALGWVYYLTRSVLPCILIHIFNNGMSVFLSTQFPQEENLAQIMGAPVYVAVLVVAVVFFAMAVRKLLPYQETTPVEGEQIIENP